MKKFFTSAVFGVLAFARIEEGEEDCVAALLLVLLLLLLFLRLWTRGDALCEALPFALLVLVLMFHPP